MYWNKTWYTVMVWNDTINRWVWKQPRRFATMAAADAYASRHNYSKYIVIDFDDYNHVNRKDYIITYV